jgi:hypothetical protein
MEREGRCPDSIRGGLSGALEGAGSFFAKVFW